MILTKTFEARDYLLAETKAQTLVRKGFSDPWLFNTQCCNFC